MPRGRLSSVCYKQTCTVTDTLLHRRPSIVDRALQQPLIDNELFVQNRDLFLTQLHSTPSLRGVPVGILPCRLVQKNQNGVATRQRTQSEITRSLVLTDHSFWQNPQTWQTDGRTDTAWRHSIASRGKAVLVTNQLTGKTNITTIKWQHKIPKQRMKN